jgi:hypothetical protein
MINEYELSLNKQKDLTNLILDFNKIYKQILNMLIEEDISNDNQEKIKVNNNIK